MPKAAKTQALHLKDNQPSEAVSPVDEDASRMGALPADRRESEDERAFPDRDPAKKKTGEF